MGTTSLEARLRWRLVAVLAPALLVIGIAAVVVTARALEAADDARARAIAAGVARSLSAELAEGDAPAEAEHEATAAIDPGEVRVSIDGRPPAGGLPPPIDHLDLGQCVSAEQDGATWRVCSAGRDGRTVTAAVRTEAHRQVLHRLASWMAAAVLVALLGAILASRFALASTLRALRALAEWATTATREARPPAPRDDTIEIDHLARRFDALVGDLVDALARERASSAHIAHELRTPLTAIIAELDALHGSEAIERMRDDAERLARVIDAILVLSGPPEAKRSGTIVNVADIARKLAPAGTTVEAPDEALVEAEPELVELAIRNLVENAARYAPSGLRLVAVVREADRVRIGVVDEGPGVPLAAREHMFDRYWRESGDGAGRGLGLALVRTVAERCGGRADARDGRNGSGLDVGFSLGPILGWSDV